MTRLAPLLFNVRSCAIAQVFTIISSIALALIAADSAFGQNAFVVTTGTCSGCSHCLLLNEAGSNPVKLTASCSAPTCTNDFRSADIFSDRGAMRVLIASQNGNCQATLFGNAMWTPVGPQPVVVVFSGPRGATQVTTRARYLISTLTAGDGKFALSAKFNSLLWMNETPIQSNANFELQSPPVTVPLNTPVVFETNLRADASSSSCCGQAYGLLKLPLTDVFVLPEGFTANCVQLNVVNNQWMGIESPGDVTNNGAVDVDDLLEVINSWGSCPSPCPLSGGCAADIAPSPAGNCEVDVDDLLAVINGWS